MLRLQLMEHPGERLQPPVGKHTDDLAAHARGIGERPEQVEDRAQTEVGPDWSNVPHGRMVDRGQEKSDAGHAHCLLHGCDGGGDIDPKRIQHVRGPGLGRDCPVAVLRDRHAAPGDHQGRRRRDIYCAQSVTAGATGIDRSCRGTDARGLRAHGLGGARDLLDLFRSNAQGHQERGGLGLAGLSFHQE